MAGDGLPAPAPESRKAPRAQRRQQLIEATIDTLARRGFAKTTTAEVTRTAGLSGGIVNFHFGSKDTLMRETLKALALEYRENWQAAIALASDQPARQLQAMVIADFDEKICTPRKLAAWGAFWGEAQNRPDYLDHLGTNDVTYHSALLELCRRLIEEGQYGERDPALVARALDAVLEGLWLDLMMSAKPVQLEVARSTALACLKAFFPKHF